MTLIIYHNPDCSKSRAALDLLRAHGHQPRVVHYLEDPPSPQTLTEILQRLGIGARELMRKGEAAYSAAGLDNPDLSEEQLIAALHAHPRLIQRPIVVTDDKACIGRPPQSVLGIL